MVNKMSKKNVEESKQLLNDRIVHIKVSAKTLITILQYVIEVVELSEARGPQKKVLALSLLTNVVDDAGLDDDEKKLCMDMIENGTLGDTIDLVVSASRGKLDLNSVAKTGALCCITFLLNSLQSFLQNSVEKTKKRRNNLRRRNVDTTTENVNTTIRDESL